jgi:tetratricopeptide (TPR) repeat protein
MLKNLIIILLVSCSFLYSQNSKKNIELSDAKAKNGDYVGAKAGYDKVLLKDPNNAICLYKSGLMSIQMGIDLDDAIQNFSKAIQIKPKYSDAYWGRGMARKIKYEYKEADEDLEKAIQLDPNNDGAYISLAEVKYHLTDYEKAELYYSVYLKKNPKDFETYSDRGFVRMERLNLKEAIEDYTKAIDLNPNIQYLDYLDRGKAKYLIQLYDSANSDFNKAIEINPNSSDLLSIGIFFVEKEKFNEAISYFDKTLILDNTSSRAFLYRGFSKNGLERFEEALTDLNRAIELEPDLGYSYIQRGYCKVKLTLFEQACVDFNKAKELGEKEADEFIEEYCDDFN